MNKLRLKYFFALFALTISTLACNRIKDKTKASVNKVGEVVATAGSEFADGVNKGVEKTFENEIRISEDLTKNGLSIGKTVINSSDSATDNILTVYIIFENDFNQKVTLKTLTDKGLEYGRTSMNIKAGAGDAKYFDFAFDKRTNLDGKSIIEMN